MSLRHPVLMMTAAAAAAFMAAPGQAATTLVGADVTYNSYLNGGLLSSLGTKTVADGTTFTDGADGLRSFFLNQAFVVVQNTSPLAFSSTAFNGPEFLFSKGIADATLDAINTSPDFKGPVTAFGSGFAINYTGLTPSLGSSEFVEISGAFPLGGQLGTYDYLLPNAQTVSGGQGPVVIVPTTNFVDQNDGILVAINSSTITILNLEALAFAGGSFNGPDLTFAGLDIADAVIDPSSAPDFLGVVGHGQHDVSVTFSGLNPALGHALVIDISAAPFGSLIPPVAGVPEPAAWSLMIVGFGAAGGLLRRRRRRVPAAA